MTSTHSWLWNLTRGLFRAARITRRAKRQSPSHHRHLRTEWLEARYAPAGIDFAGAFGDQALAVDIDEEGNTYVAGTFVGTVDFDPSENSHEITSNGLTDLFVAKFSPSHELIWAVGKGGTGFNDRPNDIEVDADGNVLVVGEFSNGINFGPQPGIGRLNSTGGQDSFLWKVDADGNHVFARGIGGDPRGHDIAKAVAVTPSGEILVALESDSINNDNSIHIHGLLVKFSPQGDELSRRSISGPLVKINDLAVDELGNVFTTGHFTQTSDFNPSSSNFNMTSGGQGDIFVTKFNSAGKFVWARKFGGQNGDTGLVLAVDSGGDVHVAGHFRGTVDFRPGRGVANLTAQGSSPDGFILKLTGRGDFVRVRQIRGSDVEELTDLALDADDNLYVTGAFEGTADFDTGTAATQVQVLTADAADVFVAKYDSNMFLKWVVPLGDNGSDSGQGIVVTPQSAVIVVGRFAGVVDFDPGDDSYELAAAGEDAFLWQMPQHFEVEISQEYEHLRLALFEDSLVLRDVGANEVLETIPLERATGVSITGDSRFMVHTLTIGVGDLGFFALPQGISLDAAIGDIEVLGDGETGFTALLADEHSGRITATGRLIIPVGQPSTFIDYQGVLGQMRFAFANFLTLVTPFSQDEISLSSTELGTSLEGTSSDGLPRGSFATLPSISFHDVTSFSLDSARHDRPTVPSNDHIQLFDGALDVPGLRDARFSTGAGNDILEILLLETPNLVPPVAGGVVKYDGGTGSDQVHVEADADVTLANTSLTLAAGGPGAMELGSVELGVLIGGPADNVLSAKAFSGSVSISGDAGNDLLVSGKAAASLNGGSGDDVLRGDAGNDDLDGGSGDDVIEAGNGNNRVAGGTGDDRLTSGRGSDLISGGDGNDLIAAGDANNTIIAGDGQDSVTTGTGDDIIFLGEGDDSVNSGAGDDEIDAGGGDDAIDAGSGDDIIFAGAGFDKAVGGTGNDQIDGGDGDDHLTGGTGNDRLIGAEGVDILLGGDGRDYLKGDEGDDELDGGTGTDTMDGCLDLDTFDVIEIFLNCDLEDPLPPPL